MKDCHWSAAAGNWLKAPSLHIVGSLAEPGANRNYICRVASNILTRCPICNALNRVDLTRLSDGPKCAECKVPLHLDRPQKVADADFDRIVGEAAVPVVVDFWADWCGPCRMMAPALDQFAAERVGEVLVLKLDTDANPQTTMRFNIRGIPTLIAFRDGKEHRRHTGLADARTIAGLIA